MRRVSQSARLAVFFLALLAPAIAMYPSLLAHATEAKERLVAEEFGPQALSLREDLQRRLQQARRADRRDPRRWTNCSGPTARRRRPNRAFAVWSRTELATYRLTSAVELYGAERRDCSSRFALSLPEYSTTRVSSGRDAPGNSCSTRCRRSVRASATCCAPSRGVCVRGRDRRRHRRARDARLPDAAVHLVAERVSRVAAARTGRSRRKACRAATSSSRSTAGAARRSSHRAPASGRCPTRSSSGWWSRASRSGRRSSAAAETFRVYFLSDRGGIYALGYPVITWFGHLINLAELVMLAARALPRAARRRRRSSARSTLADAGERPRAAARGALELLPQAVPRVRRRRGRARWSSWRSPRGPTSPTQLTRRRRGSGGAGR